MNGFWVPFLVPVVLFLVIKLRLTLIRSLTSIYSIIYSTESDSTHTIPTTYSVLGISNSLYGRNLYSNVKQLQSLFILSEVVPFLNYEFG